MNIAAMSPSSRWGAKLLAVLSVALFWLLPWSPLIAIAAVSATRQSCGWERRTARTGAVPSIALTLLVVGLSLRLMLAA